MSLLLIEFIVGYFLTGAVVTLWINKLANYQATVTEQAIGVMLWPGLLLLSGYLYLVKKFGFDGSDTWK
jgi:uncharacterized membrane protein YgdD (TMEM256/DUF423 family)